MSSSTTDKCVSAQSVLKEALPERRIESDDLPRIREGFIRSMMHFGMTREEAIAQLDAQDDWEP